MPAATGRRVKRTAARTVALAEDPAQPVPLASLDAQETPEHPDLPDSPATLCLHLARSPTPLHALLALEANQATLALLDLPDSLEHLASPALAEEPRHPESLAHLDSPETTELPDNPDRLDSLEHLHPTKPRELHLLAHQETLEPPDSPETLDLLDSLVAPAPLARRDLPVDLDSPEALDNPDRLDRLASPGAEASVESAPSTAPSTAECSSRTVHEDVKQDPATDESGSGPTKTIIHFHSSVALSSSSLSFGVPVIISIFRFICSFPTKKKSKLPFPR